MKSVAPLVFSFWRRRHLPILLQTEAAECGLTCLSMIASFWGHQIDTVSMRRRFSVSLKGSTLKQLMSMAQALALQSRPLKLDMPDLPKLRLPCVLHWDLNHFVVLKSVSATHVVIHDPSLGERRLPLTSVAQHFTGVALELTPTAQFQPKKEVQEFSLFSLTGRIVGLKRGLAQILVLGLALQVCALVMPFFMQWLVDEALLAADHDLVTILACGFLLLIVIQAAIGAVRSWITTVLTTDLNLQWLTNSFAHLMKLPLANFEKRHTGDVVSRFSSMQTIQHALTTQFVEGLIDGVLVLGTLAMMLLYSTQLAATACVAVVLYIALRCAIYRSLREASAEQIIHLAKQQTHFLESVRGVQSVKLFGHGDERRASWMNTLANQFNSELRIARLSLSYQTANTLLFGCERIIVIWLAALAVLHNQFSVGMLIAFISYKDQFSQRTASLIDKLFDLKMLHLHGDRVADILLAEPEQDHPDVALAPDMPTPAIEIRNLSFRYADGEPDVLTGINLTIPAAQFLAITGPSGCGKTTLVKLLLGLLEPSSGEILINGVNLTRLGRNNYRQLLGTVMQEDTLFAGSIADNISFFDATPDHAKIDACVRRAAIQEEIARMPMGLHTLVSDLGAGLSGGQRQRILLARALYRTPKILVLDEATSHLDVSNEKAVNEAIRQIELTRIVVAHRPDTIDMAERVVVMHQGRLVHDSHSSTGHVSSSTLEIDQQ